MSFLDQLSSIKLKETNIVHESSFTVEEDVTLIQNASLDINIECWIDELVEHTFETQFVPLTLRDAALIMRIYENERRESDEEDVEDLKNRLQRVIDQVIGDDDGVFIKTSCRSAKDTTLYAEKFQMYFDLALAEKCERSVNEQIVCLLEAGTWSLKVANAEEFFMLISSSERVYHDFELALQRKERFLQNFVVRKWVPIDVDMEFRGFVYDNELVAISQYNYVAYFPRVVEKKDYFHTLLQNFFKQYCQTQLQDKYREYIIDFAVTGDQLDKVWIIELNEYMATTDGCLFKWATDESTLKTLPIEFRVVEGKIEDPESNLSPEWKQYLQ